jgi:hypothetical protein
LIASNKHISLQGVCQKADTSVTLNLEQIKQLNAKLIEREYYKDLNDLKDSLIVQKDNYIQEQNLVIGECRKEVVNSTILNEKLSKNIKTYKTVTVIGSGCIIGLLIGLILK